MQLSLANILVDVDGIDDSRFFGDYLVPSPAPVADLSLCVTPELVQAEREIASQPYFSDTYLTQLALLRQLAEKGPAVGRFLMHAAVLEYDGRAYAFTASSGTGKSTHLQLWRRTLGNAVQAVNGDKPLLYASDAEVMACGTPWSGKEGWQRNVCVPLGGLCFISRGEKDVCRRIEPADVLERALRQLYVPSDASAAVLTVEFLDVLLRRVPVYELFCTMEPTAVRASFEAMTGQDFDACLVNNDERNSHED